MLGTDPDDIGFNLYRRSGSAGAVKVNAAPISNVTHFVDVALPVDESNTWSVRALVDGRQMGLRRWP